MPGKLQPDILQKSVLSYTGAKREDLIIGGGLAEDAALIKIPEGMLVIASDPIVGAEKNSGRLLVQVNANDVACKGADPMWLIVTLIIPEAGGVLQVERIMREINKTCSEMGIAVAGGHTEMTDRYSQPVISGTMFGITEYKFSVKNISDGDLILITGHAGLEGMSIIANDRADLFAKIFNSDEINLIRSWSENLSVVPAAKILREFANYMHDPTEGGINGALYEICAASGLGVELEKNNIPIDEFTIRAAKELNFEPLNLISSGMLIASIPENKIKDAQSKLKSAGINSSVIGKFVSGKKIFFNAHEELWGILSRRKFAK